MNTITAKYGQSLKKVWPVLAVLTIMVVVIAAIRWSMAHPYAIFWDEASYLNDVQIDAQRLRTGHLLKLGGRILIKNLGRPPAYRLIALPFVALFGFNTTGVRLTSLACFVLSALFVYLATRRISSSTAGVLAALIFVLAPEVVSASMFFSTDAPVYLATSAMLYYAFASWDGAARTSNWLGLGLAVGFGFLTKTSFLLIGLPVLVFCFAANLWNPPEGFSLAPYKKAGLLAFLIAAPWWLLSFRGALAYARYASRDFVRSSLGPPSFATWAKWFNTVLQCLIGHGLSLLIVFILGTFLVTILLKREAAFGRLQLLALGACACAALPLVAAQLSGTNHLLRHITPAVVPLAVSVGLVADRSGWTRSNLALSVSVVLFCAQLSLLLVPVVHPNTKPVYPGFLNGALPWRTMVRFEQWDWRPVQDLADRCGYQAPAISYLGNGRAFNPPQIQYPWVARATRTRAAKLDLPDVTWLWRYEDGSLDWQKLTAAAAMSDVVITAPRYPGEVREDLDNQYNAEFARRLSEDPRFQGPFRFDMGRFEPVDVEVFVKTDHVCRSGGLQ